MVMRFMPWSVWTLKSFLLFAKAKVASVKSQPLARLELQAAFIGIRALRVVLHESRMSFTEVHAWTDSMTVKPMISHPPYRWKTFVANRVNEVKNSANACLSLGIIARVRKTLRIYQLVEQLLLGFMIRSGKLVRGGLYKERELAFGALVLHRGDEERTDGPTGYRYAWKREMVDSLFEMDNSSRSGTYNVVLEVPKLDEIWD